MAPQIIRNLTQQLVQDLGVSIVTGKYTNEGDFPSEARLCEEYDVSRTSVREAIKMLTAKGLISSRPKQGIRVLPENQWNMFDTDLLNWILKSLPTLDFLLEFTEVREAIEPEAAALAAQNATPEDIVLLEETLERMALAAKGLDEPLDSDIAFHRAVLVASHNRFFIQLRAFVATALSVSIRYTNRIKGVVGADVESHRKVLEAIRDGKPELARKAMQGMLKEVKTLITKEIDKPSS